MSERLTEQLADAMDGYFDFGETGRDAEEEAAYLIAEHITKRLPGHRLIGPDDIAALRRVLAASDIADLYPGVERDHARLAALIGDDNE